MKTAKLFQHGGSQAVRLPKEFRFSGTEVAIERRGDEIILRAVERPKFKSLNDIAEYLKNKFPDASGFPDIERPKEQQERDLNW